MRSKGKINAIGQSSCQESARLLEAPREGLQSWRHLLATEATRNGTNGALEAIALRAFWSLRGKGSRSARYVEMHMPAHVVLHDDVRRSDAAIRELQELLIGLSI